MLVPALVLLTFLSAPTPAPGHARGSTAPPAGRVVLLPFEDYSGDEAGVSLARRAVARRLEARGYTLVLEQRVEEILSRERIRYLDSIDRRSLQALLGELEADAVVLGTVLSFREKPEPAVGLSLRALGRDGRVRWSFVRGLAAADTVGLLGLGRATSAGELLERILVELAGVLPEPGAEGPLASPGLKVPFWLDPPSTFRGLARPPVGMRVCILPFGSLSPSRTAPRLLAHLLASRLGESGFLHVVEPAEVRAALRALAIRSMAELEGDALRRLAERLGAELFLEGTVHAYDDGAGEARPPRVELTVRMVNIQQLRVVWAAHHRREGEEYAGLLRRGAVRDVTALADRVVGELVTGFREAPADGGPRRRRAGANPAAPASPPPEPFTLPERIRNPGASRRSTP